MRELLIYLSWKYQGDYNKIKKAIVNEEVYDTNEIHCAISLIRSKVVTILDEDYPFQLRDLKDPPYVLFYYGDLSLTNKHCLAMIGMRECSAYGREMAAYITQALRDDFVIVSGMAKGIDSICHQHAKQTIAVLGCGIDYCYPRENKDLYEWIKQYGLVLSEYPEKTAPRPYYFPWRNRIVAALGMGVVVIEAKKKSGTMITVTHALNLGRLVFCVPCRLNDHIVTLTLIKDGAYCLESVQDIYDELNLKKKY